jgi:hypothetical protein
MHWIVGAKAASGAATSPSQMGRFETRWLTEANSLVALANLSGQWADRVHGRRQPRGILTGPVVMRPSKNQGKGASRSRQFQSFLHALRRCCRLLAHEVDHGKPSPCPSCRLDAISAKKAGHPVDVGLGDPIAQDRAD